MMSKKIIFKTKLDIKIDVIQLNTINYRGGFRNKGEGQQSYVEKC